MATIIMLLAAGVWAGLCWLLVRAIGIATSGNHPRPEAPSVGADVGDDDPDQEREHTAWLGEAPGEDS